MKKFIINNCMNYIKKHTNYSDEKLKEIEYGIVSIYLTFSKIIIILALSLLLGIFKEVIIFMICFNILRTTGFGLHATKSWICLLSSTFSFIIVPIMCKYVEFNIYIKLPIVNKTRRMIYKILSTTLAIIFSISAIIIKNNFLSNCLIFALILENIMIAPMIYKLFKLPYNNYITFLKKHPDFNK